MAFRRKPEIISSSTFSFDKQIRKIDTINVMWDAFAKYQATSMLCTNSALANSTITERIKRHQPTVWQV